MYTSIGQTATDSTSPRQRPLRHGTDKRVRSPPDASAPEVQVGCLRNPQRRLGFGDQTRGQVAPPSGPKARPARGASLRTNDARSDRGPGPRSGGRSPQKERGTQFLRTYHGESVARRGRAPPRGSERRPIPSGNGAGARRAHHRHWCRARRGLGIYDIVIYI